MTQRSLTAEWETDDAFHGLIALPNDAIPLLREALRAEPDPVVRAIIVCAIWHRLGPGVVGFLGAAPEDPHPEVWKSALDGLVSVASPRSRQAVEQTFGGIATGDPERLAWIAEAIGQIDEALGTSE